MTWGLRKKIKTQRSYFYVRFDEEWDILGKCDRTKSMAKCSKPREM